MGQDQRMGVETKSPQRTVEQGQLRGTEWALMDKCRGTKNRERAMVVRKEPVGSKAILTLMSISGAD